VHEVARALVASAPPHEHLWLFSSSWKDRLDPQVVPGASVVDRRFPVQLLNYLWHRLEWPALEQVAEGAFDIAQSMHPLMLPSASAARVVTIHDLDFLDHPERTSAEVRRDYGPLVADHAARADQIVVVSADTAREVETRLGIPAANVSICPPGAPAWEARETEPAIDGCILFLGTLEPRKNLGVLLEAYERMVSRDPATPRLVLAGRHAAAGDDFVARTHRPPLEGRVELPGYVDEPTKRALFQRALVFVLPSHAEGFGMPALEAMTAGVPVVAANRGALPEVVGAAARLFDADEPDMLATVLTDVLGDAQMRRRMTDAGIARARSFTWTSTATRLRDAWQLARAHHARRRG
jgi:glycosyltransferase involved in cell wall biosynthesis